MRAVQAPLLQYARSYWSALRVRTLGLAVTGAGAGLLAAEYRYSLALPATNSGMVLLLLVLTAGVAAQAGANLINDFFEGSFHYQNISDTRISFFGLQRSRFDVIVFLSGLAALGAAALIGLYLVWLTDGILLIIGLIGIAGAYAYTGEPFVYKRYGLSVPASFVLMGPLMNVGAWYVVTASLSWYPVLFGLPAALFVPALMLSNEVRDLYSDQGGGLVTFAVRMGLSRSIFIYNFLIWGAFGLTLLYVCSGLYPPAALSVALALPWAVSAGRHVSIRSTVRLHCVFSLLLFAALILSF